MREYAKRFSVGIGLQLPRVGLVHERDLAGHCGPFELSLYMFVVLA